MVDDLIGGGSPANETLSEAGSTVRITIDFSQCKAEKNRVIHQRLFLAA
jgi:hypothetical protein